MVATGSRARVAHATVAGRSAERRRRSHAPHGASHPVVAPVAASACHAARGRNSIHFLHRPGSAERNVVGQRSGVRSKSRRTACSGRSPNEPTKVYEERLNIGRPLVLHWCTHQPAAGTTNPSAKRSGAEG